MLVWQAADGEAQQRARRETHVRGGGEDVCDDFAQPCAPWRASSAGVGIFFQVPHSSGLFSRQGTPLFEDTCEARGERSDGGREQSDGAICGCASSRSACHRLWARGAWPRARLCCACCRDGGLLRTDGPVSSLGGATSPCLSLYDIDSRHFAWVVATLVSKGYRFSKMENRPQNGNGNTHTMCSCSLTPCLGAARTRARHAVGREGRCPRQSAQRLPLREAFTPMYH